MTDDEEEQIFLRAIEGGLVDDLLVKDAADASVTAYARLLALVDRTPGPREATPEGAVELAPDEWYSVRWRPLRDAISDRIYGVRTIRARKAGVK